MFQTKEIILVFVFLGSAASLQVSIIPVQGEISVGESKFFLCEVVGGAKGIDWFSPTGEKIAHNRQDISAFQNDDTSSTLTIYNANIDDAGAYKCVATSGDRQAEATVNVKIYQKITFKNAPSPQEFTEKDNAVIVCDVLSSPPPTVIWKHKRTKIQFDKDVRFKVLSNNHLQIRRIQKTDEGEYTCEALIMARGEIDFRTIRVVVNVLPVVRVRHPEVNSTADMGLSATLACDAEGFPKPMVSWTRNHVLESGDKYSFSEDGSEMTVMDVKKLDEGDYTCIARNKAGQSEEEVSLRVFVKPKITYLENRTATEMEERVTLTCEATGDPTPSITWSFGARVFAEGEQEHLKRIYQASWTRPEQHKSTDGSVVVRSDARVSSLTLKNAQHTDGGQYLCTARSPVGEASQPTYLEVQYAPKILGSVVVYTWEGNAANISCEVLAHPSEVSIVWLRDGLQLPNANASNVKIYTTPSASYLEVNPDSQNDFGSYNCTASNEIGTESKEFILIQADVPSAPTVSKVEPYTSTAQVHFAEPDALGGVPVLKYRVEWRLVSRTNWVQRVYEVREGGLNAVTITGLKPETRYEVKMSAINGKGEGENSLPVAFKTEPVREPSPPKLVGILQPKGNVLKVNWLKQDDGGSPITHYLVRYKARHDPDWKSEVRVSGGNDYALLSGLDWDTEYDVLVVAENQRGKSQPGTLAFRTASEPAATPDSMEGGVGLNTGLIVGILVLVCALVLLAIDAACCFLNKCGILMCVCGRAGASAKGKDAESGKAAFIKDNSKEPIVETRTEDQFTANHDVGGHPEPNETTPLTEAERLAEAAASVVDLPLSMATNSELVTDTTFDLSQSSPVSESTTLTSNLAVLPPDPPSVPSSGPDTSTPKTLSQRQAASLHLSDTLLVDLTEPSQTNGSPIVPLVPQEEALEEPEKEAMLASILPSSHKCSPMSPTLQNTNEPELSMNHQLQLDGGVPLASETQLPHDGLYALTTAGSSGPSAPPIEKVMDEEKTRCEEEELMKVRSEADTEPNAVPLANATAESTA